MTPERWSQVEATFEAVVDRPSVERSELLARLCGGDEELLHEVEGLLAADAEARGFLEPPPLPEVHSADLPAPPVTRVGPYRVLEKVGEGGMSSVFAAVREDEAYEKKVAVKFFRPELESPVLVQRFRVERQILANLDHPYIARLLDGGSTPGEVPYLIMEYVEGRPIDEYCDARKLGVEARLELVRKVCSAVQYAHANLVVHRDVKPSNILVRSDGEPKLLDFGIAKLLSPTVAPTRTEATRQGAYVMTPEYASPEQARGEAVTTAADVYSLGILLYRVLTGALPYDVENRPLPEILRVVCEEEPVRPSVRAATLTPEAAAARGVTPRALARRLRGDLDTIVLKALRKEPERRYGSVEQLSEDLRRHLAGLPVAARPDTLGYRSAKFVRRNRLGVAMAMLAALAAAAFVATLVVQAVRLRHALARAEAVTRFLKETLGSANPYGGIGRDVTLVEVLRGSVGKIDTSLGGEPETSATVRETLGVTFRDLARYGEAQPLLEQALATRRRILGPDHPAVAESLMDLGELLSQTSGLKRAEELLREAVAVERRAFGNESLEAADALSGLGGVLRKQGDYGQAETVLREALAIRQRRLPGDDAKVAQSLRTLGAVLHDRGDYKAAEPLLTCGKRSSCSGRRSRSSSRCSARRTSTWHARR
jgi:serine/threonine protein kinase